MREVGGYDEPARQGDRAGGGAKSSGRPRSPPRGPRRSPDRESRHRQYTRPEPPVHPHQGHPGRGRDHGRQPSPEGSTRHRSGPDDLIVRHRGQHLRDRESGDRSRRRSRSRDRPGSPHSAKRHRSRSHSPIQRHRKKSKRHESPSRHRRNHDETSSKHRRRPSPHDYRQSSFRHNASPRRGDDLKRQRHHSGEESPMGSDSRHGLYGPRNSGSDAPRPRNVSRSPAGSSRRTSGSRRPASRERTAPLSSGPPARNYSTSDLDRRASHRDFPRSPRAQRERRRRRESPGAWSSARSDIADDMISRGSYRGGYHPAYSRRPSYHNDPRTYSQSPQPPGSYHNSPAQSPYGATRPGRTGRFSPSHQYPPHYHDGGGNGYGPPVGPQDHYGHGPPRSPPYGAPPHHQSGYREGDRAGGPRGSMYNGSGGQRGHSFKPESARGYPSEDERLSTNGEGASMDDAHMRDETSKPPPDDGQKKMPRPRDEDDTELGGPTGRPPPSGPSGQSGASGKFSFAFKPTKPAAAAPKPEISQKLTAAPQRKVSLDRGQTDRAPPPSAPTEPYSARPRPEAKNPPDGPRLAPRMRKVTKVMKRPKPRPTLSPDLVGSDSVFFRKPGNESVVGSGTYGKVFKGLNVYTKNLVALKRIRMEGERDGFPVTAVREIKLLQSLRHTNIVNLQEVMVERNDCFMVFEYMSHDLTGLLNHPTFKLEPAQKKHLAKQLFEGLDYLHTRGVLHRDIKAANVLVSSDGILKLADFGLARFYAKHHRLDYTNRVITIWYRSPELLLGETKYTAAVDVWSAACVVVEIFTRNAIFPGDGTELSQLDKIYNMLGTPNLKDWPGLVDMAWFELLKPTAKRKNVFGDTYKDRITPEAFSLLSAMFRYDPSKRPTAAEALQHPYFTTEEPLPRQAIELSSIGGDWHEFESKALRKENERRDREARKASRDKDRKRPTEAHDHPRDAKRAHLSGKPPHSSGPPDPPPAKNDEL